MRSSPISLCALPTGLYSGSALPSRKPAMEILLKQFADKICRAYRWRNQAGMKWKEAVLRFDDFAFVYIQNRY